MPGRKYSVANTDYRYGFNGKENDSDVKGTGNQIDYGMRMYDPRLGRWLSTDPKTGKYAAWSPYNYSLSSPIWINDPDGEDIHITISNTPSGYYTELRVIGSENVSGAPQSLRVHLYKATVTDDVTRTTSTYYVTRDSYVLSGTTVVKGSNGKNETLYNIENVPFEPKVSVGKYTAVEFNYPSQATDGVPTDFTAYAFRENGKGKLEAVPMPYSVQIKQRANEDEASGVMLHVGGEYTDQNGQGHVTGSFGCFGLCDETGTGGNANIEKLNKDVDDRQAKQVVYKKDSHGNILKKNGKPIVEKDYGENIHVNVQKRTNYRKNFKVDENGKIR